MFLSNNAFEQDITWNYVRLYRNTFIIVLFIPIKYPNVHDRLCFLLSMLSTIHKQIVIPDCFLG